MFSGGIRNMTENSVSLSEGRKGNGMMLSSTTLTWKLREYFGKQVRRRPIVAQNISSDLPKYVKLTLEKPECCITVRDEFSKPFWGVYNNK